MRSTTGSTNAETAGNGVSGGNSLYIEPNDNQLGKETKMKKFLATVIALSAITAAFTGCSGNNTSSNSSSSSSSDSSSTASDSSSAGTSQADSSSDGETTERTAEDLAQAVFQAIDWVSSEQITDAEIAKTMVNLDLDLLDDYSIYVPTMSVHLDEIVIVKPKAGKEDEVKAQLDEHFAYIKDGAAFYPDQEIAAAGAVEGETYDGFYYIIVNQIGSQIEDIIRDYKPGDTVTKLEVPEPDYSETVPTDELGEPFYGDGVIAPSTTAEAVMPGDGDAVVSG